MCGIAGILKPSGEVSESELLQMSRSLRHRGPDASGHVIEAEIGICHTRLAILDLSNLAAQPMASQDDRFVLSYNGEIFNYQTLRNRLEKHGIAVRSTGDTEVLLENLAHFGVRETLTCLEGQFAFALWDRVDRKLVLARDRHGIKPLYYAIHGEAVYFASELKSLLHVAEVDPTGVDALLLGLPCTWGDRTPFRNIQSVKPGTTILFEATAKPVENRYFHLSDFVDAELFKELDSAPESVVLAHVEAALEESIDLRLISDAPLACLLSGGLDSCLVAALANTRVPEVGLFHADVVGNSETDAAQQAADRLQRPLLTTKVDDQAFVDCIPEVVYANDLPAIYHLNSMPFYLVCKLAREHGIKVLLTGEGSDEYFLGYPKQIVQPFIDRVNGFKRFVRNSLAAMSSSAVKMFWPDFSSSSSALFQRLVFRYENDQIKDHVHQALQHIPDSRERSIHASTLTLIESHLSSLLHRNDRLGMAWGLESRFPFLGHALARLAINLPSRYKLRRSFRLYDSRHPFVIDKWCVREICKKSMPVGLAHRKKRGFPVSVYERIVLTDEFLHNGFVADWYRLPRSAITKLLETSPSKWTASIMMLEIWGQLFIQSRTLEEVALSFKNSTRLAGSTS